MRFIRKNHSERVVKDRLSLCKRHAVLFLVRRGFVIVPGKSRTHTGRLPSSTVRVCIILMTQGRRKRTTGRLIDLCNMQMERYQIAGIYQAQTFYVAAQRVALQLPPRRVDKIASKKLRSRAPKAVS